ncbi:hypothetical protein Agabi119p4_11741 [Agaricus bisporus var. burnettii]|uniref:Uncharacterized protein n=1 Tax=Agaricus bisporus var. burnettii TaxID=192524 RepID=A0A8H7EVD9_AGABI|nr:hypothetical protein Agabi119p4_11741 [Agaricus bisporus var. burnettii]
MPPNPPPSQTPNSPLLHVPTTHAAHLPAAPCSLTTANTETLPGFDYLPTLLHFRIAPLTPPHLQEGGTGGEGWMGLEELIVENGRQDDGDQFGNGSRASTPPRSPHPSKAQDTTPALTQPRGYSYLRKKEVEFTSKLTSTSCK